MPEQKHCLNCGEPISDKYCPHCGQRTDVERVSWKYFGEELVHTVTHAERSLLGTTWKLIKQPGLTLKEYFSGKRKKYHAPVGFFLIWVTLSTLLHQWIIKTYGFHPVYMPGLTFDSPESIKAFVLHGQIFYILSFPITAAWFYLFLSRPHFSYIESIVITMYAYSIVYVLFIVCYLVGGILLQLNVLHWKFYLFQILLTLVYTTWVCYQLLYPKKVNFFWLRLIICG